MLEKSWEWHEAAEDAAHTRGATSPRQPPGPGAAPTHRATASARRRLTRVACPSCFRGPRLFLSHLKMQRRDHKDTGAPGGAESYPAVCRFRESATP